MTSETVMAIGVAMFGSVGFWQVITWLLNRRANQRKAEAEADRETAGALAAAVGINKAEFEADSVAVKNSQEIMAQALNMLKVYQDDLATAREEKRQIVDENRKLQAQIRHLEESMTKMTQRFDVMDVVIIDLASGMKRLSDQLKDNGLQPIWKPTVTMNQLQQVLSADVMGDVKRLFD